MLNLAVDKRNIAPALLMESLSLSLFFLILIFNFFGFLGNQREG
jgi:hypothetical protein